MADNQLDVKLETMALWALPTAIASFIVFVIFSKIVEARLLKAGKNGAKIVTTAELNKEGQ